MFSKSKINRRDIFFGKSQTSRSTVSSSLEPYTQPLTQAQVYHLLRRATFGIPYTFAQKLVGKTANEVVELLFDNALIPIQQQPPSWVNVGLKSPYEMPESQAKADAVRKLLDLMKNQNQELKIWWLKLLSADNQSVREKMTLFWHGHFVSQTSVPAQLLYRQNQLLRELHQGDFRTFLERITLDGAMLIYLNGNDNLHTAPNENYARELLELFTMGIGNYDEWDIREVAKVLTGWRTNYYVDNEPIMGLFKTYEDISQHNQDAKYFFYEILSVKYDPKQDTMLTELKLLIDRILTLKTKPTADFMCKKFYRFFVYSNPTQIDQTIIDGLSATFITNKFQIRPVLSQLLKSQHFFDEMNIGVQIKTPVETILSFSKHFPIDINFQESMLVEMQQELLNPPNVAGWKGYHNWITTKTLPFAISTLSNLIDNQTHEAMASWASQFPTYQSSMDLTKTILELFHPKVATKDKIATYEQKLLGGSPSYEWPSIIKNNAMAGQRLKVLLKEMIKVPDFYLG